MSQEEIKELTPDELAAEKAKIKDQIENPQPKDGEEDPKLPSEGDGEGGEKLYANNFKSVEELKKGIQNIGSDLPEYIIEGMSDEALEQYYVELRKDFSSGKKVEEGRKHVAEEEKKDDGEDVDNGKSDPTDKPSDSISDKLWAELETTFAEKGAITSEQYEALNKVGIPDAVVDKYIDGLKSTQDAFTNKVYDMAGGEENYNEIKAWAESNYSQAELDAIASGTPDEIFFKLKGVKADFDSQVGSDRVRGKTGKSTGDSYRSQDEYILDRTSPEYKKDRRFKAKVDAKFANSHFA